MATDSLLSEFPSVSTELWEEAIHKDLKGADYARKLIWQTEEGLAVRPYYRAEDIESLEYLDAAPGDFPYVRGSNPAGDWRICEEVDAVDPVEANRAACSAVTAGAEKIVFRNVAIEDASDLGILENNLAKVPVHLQDVGEPLLRLLNERLMKRPRPAPISTGWSPLGNLDFAAEIARTAPPEFVPFNIHGEEFEEAGATAVEEVGFTLAGGVDFLAEMQSREADLDRAAASIAFSFAMGANYFFQIAKLRAFRMVWAQAVEAFGGTRENAKARIHARTSRWNKAVYDPHVNILRATTEAMSAVLGGADSISVAPFDECYKAADEASRRLARNTQILIKQEALLSRVADPGGGSYYLEVLTDFIARESWKVMQAIESTGGYRKAHSDGQIAQALRRSLAAREKAVASGCRVFAGTNKYADPSETALDRVDLPRLAAGRRATRAFEELRLRTERHVATGGKCPRILLAEIGDARMRTARSSFAANFFSCAGFDIVTQQCSEVEEIAAIDSELIVLCSSDPEYLALIRELLPRMTALGRKIPVLIAGHPDSAMQLRAAGVADFVHIRTDPIEFLTAWQQQLGIRD
jgi:methylmalonyl-CoA mutase